MQPTHPSDLVEAYVKGTITFITQQQRGGELQKEHAVSTMRWLRDYRTIGVRTPRQTGGTFALHRMFLNDSNGVLITHDEATRESFRSDYTRQGVYIQAASRTNLEDHGLGSNVMNRVFTKDQVVEFMKMHERSGAGWIPEKPKTVYIMMGDWFFSKVRRDKFYTWLALVTGPETLIIVVD